MLSGSASLTKIGMNTQTLSGANSYSGGTTVSAGMLIAANASALGSGNVSLSSGAALNYVATSNNPLAIGGTLSITGGAGTTIGTLIGSSPTGAQITVTGAATTTAAPVAINISGIPGVNAVSGTNTYTLIHANTASGSSLNNATYSLGRVLNSSNFTIGAFSKSATDLQVSITGQTPLSTEYWQGGLAGASNVWAVSNGSTASNATQSRRCI